MAFFWIVWTGVAWRDMHEDFDKWSSVLPPVPALGRRRVCGSICSTPSTKAGRQHQPANDRKHENPGAPLFSRRERGTPRQGLDRSKGGSTTKIHLRIVALGLPIAVALTRGEASDLKGYMPIMDADGPAPKILLADKGYGADFIREDVEKRCDTAMIPTKCNRLIQSTVYVDNYGLRHMVERCFNKLMNVRRRATLSDKTADSYLGFIDIVSIRLWTCQFADTA